MIRPLAPGARSSLGEDFAGAYDRMKREVPVETLKDRLNKVCAYPREVQGRADFRDQDLPSVICLWLLAAWFKPEVIIEVGTGYGCSLSAWLLFEQAEVHAVDASFGAWRQTRSFLPPASGRLTLHEMNAGDVDYERIVRGRRTLFWSDAHEGEREAYFKPVLVDRVFPVLRRVSHLFVMDDVDECGEDSVQSVRALKTKAGPCRSNDGRWWYGWGEVIPLVEWANGTGTVINNVETLLGQRGFSMKEVGIVFFQVP